MSKNKKAYQKPKIVSSKINLISFYSRSPIKHSADTEYLLASFTSPT